MPVSREMMFHFLLMYDMDQDCNDAQLQPPKRVDNLQVTLIRTEIIVGLLSNIQPPPSQPSHPSTASPGPFAPQQKLPSREKAKRKKKRQQEREHHRHVHSHALHIQRSSSTSHSRSSSPSHSHSVSPGHMHRARAS